MRVERWEERKMKRTHWAVPVLLLLLSAACSRGEDNHGAQQEKQSAAKPAPEHVWSEKTQALDKAKSVEGLLLDGARERGQALERQSH